MDAHEPGETVSTQLRAHGLAPRKRLGQNFLRDTSYLKRIVDAADLGDQDDVLEIGAGTGVLTQELVRRARRVVAIELDDALFGLLQQQLGSNPNLELWHGNALDFDPAGTFSDTYKLVGNIPYYITGPLVRRYLEVDHKPSVLVFMVQREVAERIVARPGDLSILGVSVQYYAEASIVARVPARAFYPVPKVDSAILRLVPRATPPEAEPEPFFRVVKAGFSMPRKQITNSLSSGLRLSRADTQELLRRADIEVTRRAETLSVAEWATLTNFVETSASGAGT